MKISPQRQAEIDAYNAETKRLHNIIKSHGIKLGKTSGMGQNNYYPYKGLAYDSLGEAVRDIVKRENLI